MSQSGRFRTHKMRRFSILQELAGKYGAHESTRGKSRKSDTAGTNHNKPKSYRTQGTSRKHRTDPIHKD
ncbi:hypothetical protein H4Q26_011727 [Puccinia striiformis f. sp. tritici PST-130]|nr:hypothetical protein H4Q26_011727 [Puccinia striiformis f. sp. tritici PST-130]